MTCIVGIEHYDGSVLLGGDRQFTSGWLATLAATPKVFERGNVIIGVAGCCRAYQLIEHALEVPKILDGDDPDRWVAMEFVGALRDCLRVGGFAKNEQGAETANFDLLLGVHGCLYHVGDTFGYVRSLRGYNATGGGKEFALGSLHTTDTADFASRERLACALRAAADLNMGVSPPFDFVETAPWR